MTSEQLAELKVAWPGTWEIDPANGHYKLAHPTIMVWAVTHLAEWQEISMYHPVRTRGYGTSFTGAVADFREELSALLLNYQTTASSVSAVLGLIQPKEGDNED